MKRVLLGLVALVALPLMALPAASSGATPIGTEACRTTVGGAAYLDAAQLAVIPPVVPGRNGGCGSGPKPPVAEGLR